MRIFVIYLLLILNTYADQKLPFEVNQIIGGNPVVNEHLEVLGIVSTEEGLYCSGVLIDKNYVLTAAHCLAGREKETLSVYMGDGVLTKDPFAIVGQFQIENYFISPGYEFFFFLDNAEEISVNDIAVIQLKESIEGVVPVPILSNYSEIKKALKKNNLFEVVGFGSIDSDGEEMGQKRSVTIPLIDYTFSTANIQAKGKDSCVGDSGGPAFTTNEREKKLFALVSFGTGGMWR